MSLFRWDSDSRTYSVVGLASLAVMGYVVVTTDRTYYLHLPALWGVAVGAYTLVAAVMPDLRGIGGLRRRALAGALAWTSTILLSSCCGGSGSRSRATMAQSAN